MLARHLTARVWIAGTEVTREISPYLEGISYEDVLSGATDTVELELDDTKRLFIDNWFPERGMTLEVELIKENWQGDGLTERLPLGVFEIDEVTNSYPPSVCKLKGNSCSENSALRQTDISRSWENVRLSKICADIAAGAGVTLVYQTAEDSLIQRAEQAEVSSLDFLDKLCADYYLSVKIADGKLIVFETETLEAQEPVLILDRDASIIQRFSGTATLTEIYKAAQVNYSHGKHAEQYTAEATTGRTTGKTLKINQRVESQAEAERLARNALRDKNREEIKISLTTIGDFRLLSGNTVELRGHGRYDGKYLIKRARHTINSDGYECNLEAYRCEK